MIPLATPKPHPAQRGMGLLLERWAGLAPASPRRKRDVFPWTTNAATATRSSAASSRTIIADPAARQGRRSLRNSAEKRPSGDSPPAMPLSAEARRIGSGGRARRGQRNRCRPAQSRTGAGRQARHESVAACPWLPASSPRGRASGCAIIGTAWPVVSPHAHAVRGGRERSWLYSCPLAAGTGLDTTPPRGLPSADAVPSPGGMKLSRKDPGRLDAAHEPEHAMTLNSSAHGGRQWSGSRWPAP